MGSNVLLKTGERAAPLVKNLMLLLAITEHKEKARRILLMWRKEGVYSKEKVDQFASDLGVSMKVDTTALSEATASKKHSHIQLTEHRSMPVIESVEMDISSPQTVTDIVDNHHINTNVELSAMASPSFHPHKQHLHTSIPPAATLLQEQLPPPPPMPHPTSSSRTSMWDSSPLPLPPPPPLPPAAASSQVSSTHHVPVQYPPPPPLPSYLSQARKPSSTEVREEDEEQRSLNTAPSPQIIPTNHQVNVQALLRERSNNSMKEGDVPTAPQLPGSTNHHAESATAAAIIKGSAATSAENDAGNRSALVVGTAVSTTASAGNAPSVQENSVQKGEVAFPAPLIHSARQGQTWDLHSGSGVGDSTAAPPQIKPAREAHVQSDILPGGASVDASCCSEVEMSISSDEEPHLLERQEVVMRNDVPPVSPPAGGAESTSKTVFVTGVVCGEDDRQECSEQALLSGEGRNQAVLSVAAAASCHSTAGEDESYDPLESWKDDDSVMLSSSVLHVNTPKAHPFPPPPPPPFTLPHTVRPHPPAYAPAPRPPSDPYPYDSNNTALVTVACTIDSAPVNSHPIRNKRSRWE
ncbi:hypothetical protein CEUSTIGMA_g10471.t1 [Chlamydomonas eustigma]|uniref:CID domain-containing protein n=1 Tax=Chlamydomonas eustigma TaxID=1157962 RepID=A0A250XIY7_9CHLO|nr:hypothetical protein CEUSTIGMA_g10471.t1 [Chlamydomonas eustigma]|eukprot:GAX83045.1 hypothetical protein CEUSTIGMA_g10471.t1 [Chlamydomonas eustigma]